jgi:tripartite-type tricarboxylate transporter receptor subunit TctC
VEDVEAARIANSTRIVQLGKAIPPETGSMFRVMLVVCTLLCLGITPRADAAFPDRPVHIVVPFAPGGGVDVTARLLAQQLGVVLHQTVVVENHPGGGANIGAAYVAQAQPDGYTLLMGSPTIAINASLYKHLPYNLETDFVPVALVQQSELVLAVAADSKFHSVQDIVTAAKAKPGQLSYGSAGVGSVEHLAGELFKQLAGIDVLHVPYKGTGPAINDTMSGQVQFLFGGSASLLQLNRPGQLRALAVTSAEPAPGVDLPTMQQAGVKGYDVITWNGLLAPKGTPAGVVQILTTSVNEASAALAAKFAAIGCYPKAMSAAQFGAMVHAQVALWAPLVAQAHLHVD